MFFRIAGHSRTEVCAETITDILFKIDAVIQVNGLFQQVNGIPVSFRLRLKKSLIFCRIASQHQHIIYAKEIQVNQSIFCLANGEPSADKMGNSIHFIMVHDGSANAHSAGTFSNLHFLKAAICFFLEYMLGAVVGDIDKGRLKLH